MGNLIIPKTGKTINGRKPTTEEYVNNYLKLMRAKLKEKVMFTPSGKTIVHESGENIIYAPNGEKICITELPEGGNKIEHGDHLHVHIRPNSVTTNLALNRSN